MEPFLYKTAKHLLENWGDDLSEVCVILPNRRAGLFLRKHLSEMISRTAWAPAVFSIEDFMTQLSGLREAETLALLFELYEVHKEVEGDKAQPFEEYLHWASQLLSDFNEIDRYMADPKDLFSYLDEARILSVWNLGNAPLTDFESKYLAFYHSLVHYYEGLTARLLERKQGYAGLIFRQAARRIDEEVHRLRWKQVVFAGFNALTAAEEKVISTLHLNRKATLLWDADPYYLNDEHQEAGIFLREWIRKWPSREITWVSDDYSSSGKEIRVIGAPDIIGQMKQAGMTLRGLLSDGQAGEQTAVVLLDESLLVPLLNSLPEEVSALNITAGLPMRQTPLAGLFDAVFRMHINTTKFTFLASSGKGKFYYKDIIQVLRHPLVHRMAAFQSGGNSFIFDDMVERIRMGTRVFLSPEDFTKANTGLFQADFRFISLLFAPWEETADALRCCRDLIEQIRETFPVGPVNAGESEEPDPNRIEIEYLFSFSRIFHQLSTLVSDYPVPLTLPVLQQLFRQVADSTTLPFFGEPLRGVQVMGMLETRTLDFENIILIACNEDLLPSSKVSPSFIPFDIKRHFRLPTYRHKDAVYAYHFYRLLQRAKNVTILYGTQPDRLGGGEPSRFISQLMHEMPSYNPAISIRRALLTTPPLKENLASPIVIEKSQEVMGILGNKAEKGLAPTAINAYRNCPFKFYLSEVAGLREPDTVEDTIDPAVLGSAVHEALHNLYKPFIDKPLAPGDLVNMEKSVDAFIDEAFRDKFKSADVWHGKNLLLVNVARMMLKRFLQSEKETVEDLQQEGGSLSMVFLEQLFSFPVEIKVGEEVIKVNAKGFLDRVDRVNGGLRIIDYKTGTTFPKQVKVTSWDDLRDNPDLNFGFQLIMYAWLLSRRLKNPVTVTAGTFSLKKIAAGLTSVSVPDPETGQAITKLGPAVQSRFEAILKEIIGEIYDPSQPFVQTADLRICANCPYVTLCGR